MKTVYETINNQITELKEESKYNLSRIMRRARYIYLNRNNIMLDYFHIESWSEALKQAWKESKKVILKKRKELKYAIERLAKQYEVKFSPEYYQNELDNSMMKAYLNGAKMN